MSLLHDIQVAVLREDTDLGPILLKVRLLAARLGSQPLADWVKHESEGYPPEVSVPDYRIISVAYTATFSGPFGSAIKHAPIPQHLIEKHAGERWIRYEMRESVAAVDDLLATSSEGRGCLSIEASNLILLLQGKVYEDYACNSVTGKISRASLAKLKHSVHSRVLELTIELEKAIPDAAKVAAGEGDDGAVMNSTAASQISQQIIYGNVTSISASGDASVNIAISPMDLPALIDFLKTKGIAEADARQLGELIASEKPESAQDPWATRRRLGWPRI
jgi:AbiTii-like protein